jgi:hypothetical protein
MSAIATASDWGLVAHAIRHGQFPSRAEWNTGSRRLAVAEKIEKTIAGRKPGAYVEVTLDGRETRGIVPGAPKIGAKTMTESPIWTHQRVGRPQDMLRFLRGIRHDVQSFSSNDVGYKAAHAIYEATDGTGDDNRLRQHEFIQHARFAVESDQIEQFVDAYGVHPIAAKMLYAAAAADVLAAEVSAVYDAACAEGI